MKHQCIYCPYCGGCYRCGGCTQDCPGKAYDKACTEWRARKRDFIEAAVAPQELALMNCKQEVAYLFDKNNPPPPEPKRVR